MTAHSDGCAVRLIPQLCLLLITLCIMRFNLSSLGRRPYRERLFDMPLLTHLLSRHALHDVRFFSLMMQLLLFLHSGMLLVLFHILPKKD
jgi:hypothetical protein